MIALPSGARFITLAVVSILLLVTLYPHAVDCKRGGKRGRTADKGRNPGVRKNGPHRPSHGKGRGNRHHGMQRQKSHLPPFSGLRKDFGIPRSGKGSHFPFYVPGSTKHHSFHNPYFHIMTSSDDFKWSRDQGWYSMNLDDEYHSSDATEIETSTVQPTATDESVRPWKGQGSFTGDIRLTCLEKVPRENCLYGIVQVYHRELGNWGTICGDKWKARGAEVVCKYLNYRNGKHLKLGPAKQTDDVKLMPKYLRKLRCGGGEWSITDCDGERMKRNYTCKTDKLAGVKCTGYLGDGATAETTCRTSEIKCKSGNRCIAPSYVCDGMGDCPWGSDEENCNEASCNKDQYWCGPNGGGCISNQFLCDGELDCIDESDERDCEKFLKSFTKTAGKRMRTRKHEVQWDNLNAYLCAQKCKEEVDFVCTSFDFDKKSRMCLLYSSTAPTLLKNAKRWDHFVTERKEDCEAAGKHRCSDGTCILRDEVCDFKDDCPNGEEEDECEPMKVRLSGGSGSFEGRVEVAKGRKYGLVCDSGWTLREANVACRQLGYGRGASKALKGGVFGRADRNYVLDNVRCTGRERTLEDCQHGGWSNTNCGIDHEAGVVCLSDETTTPFVRTTPRPTTPPSSATSTPTTKGQCGVKPAADLVAGPQPRVVGGTAADPHEWPWQVGIWLPWTYWCGGSLIHPCWVLTAAHCFTLYPPKYYTIRLGDHITGMDDGTEQEFRIAELIEHEYNTTTKENDIALLRITSDDGRCAQITDQVQTVCLPESPSQFTAKTVCQVTGWGKDSATATRPYVPVLQEADAPIIADRRCSRESEYGQLKRGMFCAGYLSGGIDSCQGDSGGPLSCRADDGRYHVWGIVSWGNGCAKPKAPGVYTKVGMFTDWIEEATGIDF